MNEGRPMHSSDIAVLESALGSSCPNVASKVSVVRRALLKKVPCFVFPSFL